MRAISVDRFILIDATRGVDVRSARTMREMITDLLMSNGEETAFWAEGEAQRCAQVWRDSLAALERESLEQAAGSAAPQGETEDDDGGEDWTTAANGGQGLSGGKL